MYIYVILYVLDVYIQDTTFCSIASKRLRIRESFYLLLFIQRAISEYAKQLSLYRSEIR